MSFIEKEYTEEQIDALQKCRNIFVNAFGNPLSQANVDEIRSILKIAKLTIVDFKNYIEAHWKIEQTDYFGNPVHPNKDGR